jgi:hypothetical protein
MAYSLVAIGLKFFPLVTYVFLMTLTSLLRYLCVPLCTYMLQDNSAIVCKKAHLCLLDTLSFMCIRNQRKKANLVTFSFLAIYVLDVHLLLQVLFIYVTQLIKLD